MRRLIFAFAVLLSGCSIVTRPCVPACGPGQTCVAGTCIATPTPTPKTCPEACPVGQECKDPAIGCVSIPAVHEPVCEPNTNCDCWIQSPGQDWSWMTCAETQTCENHVCKAVAPACPEQCPVGQECKDPAVGCVPKPPEPPPAGDACPKALAPGAYVVLRTTAYKPFVNFYSTPYVHGDPELCRLVHGVAINECHLEGWPKQQACELQLVGKAVGKPYACPIWQFSVDGGTHFEQCVDNSSALASCDHFGGTLNRDDPKTPTTGDTLETLQGFEGIPKECGLQRDIHGPMAGFFTVANGGPSGCATSGGPYWLIRACLPDGTNCGQWREFCH